MKTIKGTIKKLDLEGGIWILDTGKNRYSLMEGPMELYQDGMVVSVTGELKKDILSLGMVGPVLKVRDFKKGG
ncbi:MAG: hypothetical protein ACLFQV_06875 [Vulcanimicrobiota bacterium]